MSSERCRIIHNAWSQRTAVPAGLITWRFAAVIGIGARLRYRRLSSPQIFWRIIGAADAGRSKNRKARGSCSERSGHDPATTYSRGTYRPTTIGG